ncbi:hypothetical protein GCM10009767_13290 [Kocuria aegyptia]|uniref:Uncharacterized protein n=1 Tax=Kocuria aegyptia TaxID=330943 RepID=A0ABP4WJV8_9MICC
MLVPADRGAHRVRLVSTGCLSEANRFARWPLPRRARTSGPSATIGTGRTASEHVATIAVQLLPWTHDHQHDRFRDGVGPAKILAGAQWSDHPPAPTGRSGHAGTGLQRPG